MLNDWALAWRTRVLLLSSCKVMSNSPVIQWTVAHQAPLSLGFPRQEYQSQLPFPSPGDLPDPGIETMFPAWQADALPLSHLGRFCLLPELH